jgi:triosephosphate isomerase
MRQKSILLAGNWKMNHGPSATEEYFSSIAMTPKASALMRIYPPMLSLQASLKIVEQRNLPIQVGAQNMHFEKSGAFTGEVSGPMLQELGISQVLIGHSERRQYFAETDETVLKKTLSALNQGFEVLVCVGETLEERKSGTTNQVLETQLKALLSDETCKAALGNKLHLAYEPVWAIGTG